MLASYRSMIQVIGSTVGRRNNVHKKVASKLFNQSISESRKTLAIRTPSQSSVRSTKSLTDGATFDPVGS